MAHEDPHTLSDELTPQEIVAELDKYIVGQTAAKRAVAIALRNRYRRSLLPESLREEVAPKNILMIGPTGVGKTEIARRLAKLARSPFVKVEATKFTEVGYVGRDVESIVRDLVEAAIRIVKEERLAAVEDRAAALAKARLLDAIHPRRREARSGANPFGVLFGMGATPAEPASPPVEEDGSFWEERKRIEEELESGKLDDRLIEIEVEERAPKMLEIFSGTGVEEMGVNLHDLFGHMLPRRKKRKKMTVADARRHFHQEEADKLIDHDEVAAVAIRRAESSGIVFLDEIDKIAGSGSGTGPDVSREGVQRDILPIVEGSTVMTKYGPVRTDHILFVAAGAFSVSKPSDLIPELQGRFPIRVELDSLTQEDFLRILTEPKNALLKQYAALMETEGVRLEFTDDALMEIAKIAQEVNEQTENIGARRLHTIIERVLEEISFDAPARAGQQVTIDRAYVIERLNPHRTSRDLSHYIL